MWSLHDIYHIALSRKYLKISFVHHTSGGSSLTDYVEVARSPFVIRL